MSERLAPTPSGGLSRVPYLPGLDGLRAIAVVGVMIYHANHTWLHGGYLGVEVFFVISGYLITLLLIGEHERTGTVALRDFWLRRARRLLPALYLMMGMLLVYVTAFYPAVRESVRGDFVAGLFYVSNWYQIIVGQGYASSEAFVPLRHLWSLAVEEQFYLVWPLVMTVVLRRRRRSLPSIGVTLILASVVITGVVAVFFANGFVPAACTTENGHGYWHIASRCISINDSLYLGSISRAGGLLLGGGFAMLWRPMAVLRGPLRDRGAVLDSLAVLGLAALGFLMWEMFLFEEGSYNPWLYHGGFLLTGVATLMVIAAATHLNAATGALLGNPVLRWIGTRSYGLYLFHWPIYQIIRKQAQINLTLPRMLLAMAITLPLTELSYRFIETPIRKGAFGRMMAAVRRRPQYLVASVSVAAMLGVGAVSMVGASPRCVGAVACSLAANTEPATSPLPKTPGATTAPTTTIPKVPAKYVAIGESVMVGARNQLAGAGVVVQARENRGPDGVRNAILQLIGLGELGEGSSLVIQVGTNAPVSDSQFANIIQQIPPGVKAVWFMTLRAPVKWIPDNNTRILALPSKYPNVQVIDWSSASQSIQLCADGIHVTCSIQAKDFYANLILEKFGLPTIVIPETTTTSSTSTTSTTTSAATTSPATTVAPPGT
jgi:peptidoglycan/LPS O-acetylase OafA/YrhL